MSLKVVYLSYLKAIFKAIALVFLGSLTAYLLNIHAPVSQFVINIIGCFGIAFDAVALYGFLGWEIQTWSGDTPQEKLNYLLSNLFISLGLFCGMLAYLLVAI